MHKKVMVIDDNEMDLYISKRIIERHAFAEEVLLMESAKDALAFFEANADNVENLPSLIFLDINMPDMNGFEFLEAYNALSETVKRNSIIMMLTTSVHDEDIQRADKCPYVRNYLNKPLSAEKLSLLTGSKE